MIWLLLFLFPLQAASDPSTVSRGGVIFARSCSVGYCHGAGGEAGKGPRLRGRNLDRDYVEDVTRFGIPNSTMPGWEGRLTESDLRAVVAYVMQLSTATEAASGPLMPMPAGVGPAELAEFSLPQHVQPGHDLFFDATRGTRCATCHTAGERGLAVASDLTRLANPREAIARLRSLEPKKVVTAKLKSGETFPALVTQEDDRQVRLYDLTIPPPVLRTIERSELISLDRNTNWRHDPVIHHYSDEELQALVPYLEWSNPATGSNP